ncbi:MAG TPA: hypothetical protein VFE54_03910 [Mucilaginibacter sp.]|jgi:hypothetical protein|nr:hypothetical protein [Mucilaginibacter sp.]
MKIITLHTRIDPSELLNHIRQNIDPMFKEQRNTDLHFIVEGYGDTIKISQPELYGNEVLFNIEVKGRELYITRSEHYVDDVNSLTVESILNDLFNDLSDKHGTDLVQEG